MTDENDEVDSILLKKKADAHWLLKTVVHIPYKTGHWKRGIIKDVKIDFFLLDERIEGLVPVFFIEIKDIRPFTPPKAEGEA